MPQILHLDDIRLVMLDADDVERIHARVMTRMDHANPGLRSREILDGAVGRPMNLAVYGERDVIRLAVAYAIAVSQAHAFVDGNKRAAYGAAMTFLEANGEPAHVFVWAGQPSLAFARLIERYAMLPAERDATEATMVAFLAETLAGARRG